MHYLGEKKLFEDLSKSLSRITARCSHMICACIKTCFKTCLPRVNLREKKVAERLHMFFCSQWPIYISD